LKFHTLEVKICHFLDKAAAAPVSMLLPLFSKWFSATL
jgi:hypothetical protein